MASTSSRRPARWSKEVAASILEQTGNLPGPVLISLQSLQAKFGYLHPEAIELVALACNVSRAEVHGVLTFYHDLRQKPPPKHAVQICVAEACQSVGARELVAEIERALGVKIGEASSEIEISSAYCFGNCALGPASMIDGELVGLSTVEKIRSAVSAFDTKTKK